MDAEKKTVIKEIRCLVMTCKNGLYLKRLWKEYKETTGEYIPFRKFGFNSMDEFLRSTNQFIMRSCDGDIVVMAKPTEKSAHITKFVQCQNSTKKKRLEPPRFNRSNYSSAAQQQQQRQNNFSSSSQYGNYGSTRYPSRNPSYHNNNNNNNSNNNTNNHSYQSSASASASTSAKPFANTTNSNSNSYSQPTASIPALPPKIPISNPVQQMSTTCEEHRLTNPFLNDGRHKISMTKPIDSCESQRSQANDDTQRENGLNEKSNRMADAFGIPLKRNEQSNEFDRDQTNNMHSFVQRQRAQPTVQKNDTWNMVREIRSNLENRCTTAIPASVRSARMSRHDKALKQTMLTEQIVNLSIDTKPKVSVNSRLQPKNLPVPESSQRQNSPEPEPTIEHFDLTELDAFESAVEAITFYCMKKGFPIPSYRCYQMKSKKIICSMELNDVPYACYPEEYETQEQAEMATAQIALSAIKEHEEVKKYPVCKDSPQHIAQQINACIPENGVFLDALQTIFRSTYQQSLPNEWRLFIQSNADLFKLEMNSTGKAIVYPKRPKLISAQANPFKFRPIQVDQIQMKRLPWAQKEWNIFISTIKSIDDVRGFLYAEDDKDNLANMIEKYELQLLNGEKKETIASNIRVGGFYYTTYIENNRTRVMRIQVNDMDYSRRKAECYFIDLGEDELVSFDRIYVLDASMLEVPAQAIRFCLADLDVFDASEIECEAINQLFNNHVIAEIKTTETEYLCNGNDPMIKAIFYHKPIDDNGGHNKINLNLKIAMAASKYFDSIELEDDRLVNAIVTYVNEFGIIHCHLCEENAIPHICQLIKQLTANGIDSKYHAKNLSVEDVYLVYDEYNEIWYRAMLISLEPTDVLLFKFIDYGRVARVNIKNVYRLRELSEILNAFPPQTVNVRLYNNAANTREFIKCLQGHLQQGDVVTMDVIEKTIIPSVKIWKRIDGSGIIDIYKLCRIETKDDENNSSMSSASQRIQRKFSSNA